MEFLAAFRFVFGTIPIVRWGWRKLVEGHMEIEFHAPHSQETGPTSLQFEDETPIYNVRVIGVPSIFVWFDLTMINNRTDRPERVIEGEIHLKRHRFWLWRKTIASVPLAIGTYATPYDTDYKPLQVVLEPMSAPITVTVVAEGPIEAPVESLPRKMELVLELRMVGPIRKLRRVLDSVLHDPASQSETDSNGE